jgi:hypothetical protein
MYGETPAPRRISNIILHRPFERIVEGHDPGCDLALPEPAFSAPDVEPRALKRTLDRAEFFFIHQTEMRHV